MENLAERNSRMAKRLGNLASQGEKKRRKRRGLDDNAGVVVVAPAETYHLAVGLMAIKVKRLEREPSEFASKRLLLLGGQNIGAVAKPLRRPYGHGEQIGLRGRQGRSDATAG